MGGVFEVLPSDMLYLAEPSVQGNDVVLEVVVVFILNNLTITYLSI